MKTVFLIFTFIFITACQDYNSNSADRVKYGPVTLDESDPNFQQAYNIISSRCINCHSGYHNNWATFKDNAAWLDFGIVLRGDPDNSIFIQRIINYGGTTSNMPQGGSAMPENEYQHLLKWIEEIP